MGAVIGGMLPFAVGIAISPIPIVSVILILFSRRPDTNGLAFLGGWVLGMLVVTLIVLLLSGTLDLGDGRPLWISWLELALGILLIVLGVRRWRTRPPTGTVPALPPWLQALDRLETRSAFAMGALLSGINPKNLVLTVGGAVIIAAGGLAGAELVVSVLLFLGISSASIAAPVLYLHLRGASARPTLDIWRDWLVMNNATVMALLLVIFGVLLVGEGVAGI